MLLPGSVRNAFCTTVVIAGSFICIRAISLELMQVDEGKHLDPGAQRIYLINCLHTIQVPTCDLLDMLQHAAD